MRTITSLKRSIVLLVGNLLWLLLGETVFAADPLPETFLQLCPLEQRLFEDAVDGRLDDFSLLTAALVAGGVDRDDVLRQYEDRLDAVVRQWHKESRPTGSPRRQAEAVFDLLHRKILRTGYHVDGTDLPAAIDHGRFNCVSASVLFNWLAKEAGLTVHGLELPGHVMSRVRWDDESLDVETTCPGWFRLIDDPQRQAELVEKTTGQAASADRSHGRELSAVQMVALIYYNRAVDLLVAKRFEEATIDNAKAVTLDPASTTAEGNLLATINNWAIDLGNSQQYERSAQLLRTGLSLDAGYEAFAVNYVHVHHEWVEELCRAEQFAEALNTLAEAADELPENPFFRQATSNVCRRWAGSLLGQGRADEAFDVFFRARQRWGDCPDLDEAQAAAINDAGLALLEQGRSEQALTLFDRGMAQLPDDELLRNNHAVARLREEAHAKVMPEGR